MRIIKLVRCVNQVVTSVFNKFNDGDMMKNNKTNFFKMTLLLVASLVIILSFTAQVSSFETNRNLGNSVGDVDEDTIITEHLGTYLQKPGNWYDRPLLKIWDSLLTLQAQIYGLAEDVYAEPVEVPKETMTVLKEVYNSGWVGEGDYVHWTDGSLHQLLEVEGISYYDIDDLIIDCKIKRVYGENGYHDSAVIFDCDEFDEVKPVDLPLHYSDNSTFQLYIVKTAKQNVRHLHFSQRVRLYLPVTIEVDA